MCRITKEANGSYDDAVVEKMLHKVSTVGLTMPGDELNRERKTPTHCQHTTEPEPEAQHLWQREFFEVVDLVTEKLKWRFDQDSMKIAALREQAIIKAANRSETVNVESLHLPRQIVKDRLELQLKMLGDVLVDSPCETTKDIATGLSKLHP